MNTHANNLIDEQSGYRIRSETSFNDLGDPVPAGTSGSIRPDIVIERLNKHGGYDVVQAYDLKTGNAKITTGWESKVQTWLHPVGPTETLRPGAAAPVGASAGGR